MREQIIKLGATSIKEQLQFKGQTIKLNQVVELGDLVGEDIKKTLHWDRDLEDPIDIYGHSSQDFHGLFYGQFRTEGTEMILFQRLHRLFSKSKFKVSGIIAQGESAFLVLDGLIFVDLEVALKFEEIIFLDSNADYQSNEKDKEILEHAIQLFENRFVGLVSDKDISPILKFDFKGYINYDQTKWPINHIVNMHNGPFLNE